MADNVVLGTGRLYVAALGTDDVPGPERYLGDSTAASLAGGEGDRVTVFAGDGADRSKKLVDKLLDVTRSMNVTLHDISFDNVALFLAGDMKALTGVKAVAKSSPEQFPACKAGDEFQIGTFLAAAPGGGYPSIQTPASDGKKIGYVAGDSGNADDATAAKVLFVPKMVDYLNDGKGAADGIDGTGTGKSFTNVDVVVFGDTGRVRALKALDSGFRLSYTPVASFDYVESATTTVEAAVRYVEYNPAEGEGRTVYMAKATVTPNGEWPLKQRDAEQQFGLSCTALGKVYVSAGATAEA